MFRLHQSVPGVTNVWSRSIGFGVNVSKSTYQFTHPQKFHGPCQHYRSGPAFRDPGLEIENQKIPRSWDRIMFEHPILWTWIIGPRSTPFLEIPLVKPPSEVTHWLDLEHLTASEVEANKTKARKMKLKSIVFFIVVQNLSKKMLEHFQCWNF